MGSTSLSRKKQRLPCRSGAPRWLAPGQEPAPGRETRRRVTGLGPTANPAGHCRRSYARAAHTAFPGTRRPSRKTAQCCPRPRAAVAQGVSSFADLNLSAAPQREKARSPFKPTLPSLPVPGPYSPGALGHPSGRPPENGLASEGSGVDSREREWSEESGGLQSAAIGEGSEKGANEENQGRVGAQRSQQPVGLQLISNLGWETDSGPLGGPPPESHPLRSARAGRCRAQLEKPRPSVRVLISRLSPVPSSPRPAPPPAGPRAYLGQPQPPPPRSRAPAKGATGAPLQRLFLRRPLSPYCSPHLGVQVFFRAPGKTRRARGSEESGSRGSSASDCSTAAPYSSRAGRSESPRAGHPEDARVPIASHGGATDAATVTAGAARLPLRTAREQLSRRSRRRRDPD